MKHLGILVLNNRQEISYYTQLGIQAIKYGFTLSIFTPETVNLNDWTAKGYVFTNEKKEWEYKRFPIPAFIYDRCFYPSQKLVSKYYETMHTLKHDNRCHFIGHGLPGKLAVTRVLAKDPLLLPHIPPTNILINERQCSDLLAKYDTLLLKPQFGSQGKGIYLMKKQDHYIQLSSNYLGILTHKYLKEKETLTNWIKAVAKKRYLIQPYLSLQKNNKPYDIRILLQRGINGDWVEQGRGVRIGKANALISNLHAGAKVKAYDKWMNQYSVKKRAFLNKQVERIKERIPIVLEESFQLFEIGIDISIDQADKIWILEVNSKPGHQIVKQTQKDENLALYHTPFLYCLHLSEKK